MYGKGRIYGGKNRNNNLVPKGLKVVYMPSFVRSLSGSLEYLPACNVCHNRGGVYVDCNLGKSCVCIQFGHKFGKDMMLYNPVFVKI